MTDQPKAPASPVDHQAAAAADGPRIPCHVHPEGHLAVAGQAPPACTTYQPPKLTRVGNVRDLLAGDGGTVDDIDPAGLAKRSSPQG